MSEKHHAGYMPWDRTGNRLLIQSTLGKNKPTNYDIPEQNFIYGKITPMDSEKANQLMYSWAYHQNTPNLNDKKEKDFVATNKKCLKSLLHTSSDFSKFRKSDTQYKTAKEGGKEIKIKLPEDNFTYGKPGDLEDPIKLVLANDYGETDKILRHTLYQFQTDDSDAKKRKLSCHITKNHNLVKEATTKRMQKFDWDRKKVSKDWKLSKFQNATAKVDHKRGKGKSSIEN